MKVFIGYDEREHEAFLAAAKTLRKVTDGALEPESLEASKLSAQGLLYRVADHRGGQDYDLVSNASKSTRFAISRFLTPVLAQDGWALFTDCDVVFLEDPRHMLDEIDHNKAVHVVKHDYHSAAAWKMVNQTNTNYPRKNWSSVMLFNVDHPAHRRLSIRDINERPGRDLHRFYWLHDDEIGALDPRWNWLVGEQPKPPSIGIAHYTLGGPFTEGWKGAEHDEIWHEAFVR